MDKFHTGNNKMSLIVELGDIYSGNKLINIVERSMLHLVGGLWKFKRKNDAQIITAQFVNPGARNWRCSFYDYKTAKGSESGIVLCISKYRPKEMIELGIEYSLICTIGSILSVGVGAIPIIGLNIEEAKETFFYLKDSIFTLICPDNPISKLEFYANAGYDFRNKSSGGLVKNIKSNQYERIRPMFKQLENEILRRLLGEAPYR